MDLIVGWYMNDVSPLETEFYINRLLINWYSEEIYSKLLMVMVTVLKVKYLKVLSLMVTFEVF